MDDLDRLEEREAYRQRCREQKAREYQRRREIILARNKAWRQANPEKVAASAAAWRAANPELKAELRKQWYADNRDLQLARAAARTRDLVDSVVKSQFCRNSGLSSRDVPPDILPMIRTTLQIRRHLKTLNHKSS